LKFWVGALQPFLRVQKDQVNRILKGPLSHMVPLLAAWSHPLQHTSDHSQSQFNSVIWQKIMTLPRCPRPVISVFSQNNKPSPLTKRSDKHQASTSVWSVMLLQHELTPCCCLTHPAAAFKRLNVKIAQFPLKNEWVFFSSIIN